MNLSIDDQAVERAAMVLAKDHGYAAPGDRLRTLARNVIEAALAASGTEPTQDDAAHIVYMQLRNVVPWPPGADRAEVAEQIVGALFRAEVKPEPISCHMIDAAYVELEHE
jgi:hypothetical protein